MIQDVCVGNGRFKSGIRGANGGCLDPKPPSGVRHYKRHACEKIVSSPIEIKNCQEVRTKKGNVNVSWRIVLCGGYRVV